MLGGNKRIEELENDVRRLKGALNDLMERYEQDITVLRNQVIRLARGAPPAEDAIRQGAPFEEIHATQAHEALRENTHWIVLDVRTPDEWHNGHIPNAVHIPVDELEDRLSELPADKHQPILCVCAMGGRSAAACAILAEAQYTYAINMQGGMNGWPGDTVAD